MELIYVILADAAQAHPDGKFSLLGGGIENINASTFPVFHPGLALVVKLGARAAEAEEPHDFRVDIAGPNDFYVTAIALTGFRSTVSQDEPDHLVTFNLIINIPILVFPEPGPYFFHLYVGTQEVGNVPLNVQKL
jgi:hypothetical protein